MLQTIALPLLALSYRASALALPQVTTGTATPLFPSNTTITFYQGIALAPGQIERDLTSKTEFTPLLDRDIGACGMIVGQGTIQQGTCTTLLTAAVGLQQTEMGSCSFTVFTGSPGCDPGPDGTKAVKTFVAIPNGVGTTCVGTGVLDGGMYQQASGIWVCG